jgi:serine-type D-Ala-D-Ala endopeptidase (penicillin-binding protein 7)
MNFLEVEVARDKSSVWRGALTVFVVVLAMGGFLVQKVNFFDGNTSFNKIILQPLQNVGDKIGGDIVAEPPEVTKPKLPELVGDMLDPSQFSAHSMIVKDVQTGVVLFKKSEYDQWPIASITKLMSALVLLEKRPDWTTSTVVVGLDSIGTHMYAGDVYTLDELWLSALVASSNKAILTLAHAVDWPIEAFVERMNQKALELGMTDTSFTDPTGLDDTNVSSASDIVILLNEVLKHDKIKSALLTKEHNLYSQQRQKSHHMWNTDWLLLGWVEHDFEHFYGGKTGFINASDYNFSMRVGNGHLVDVVVLGASDHEARFTEARDIAKWALTNYKWLD